MQVKINTTKIENIKNWFFGRVPHDFDRDQMVSDLEFNFATESELPLDGDPEAKYFVEETRDFYRFIDGAYQVIDAYIYGITQEYRDTPRRVYPKVTIVDHSANIPSFPADKIKDSNSTLAVLYNVQALLIDLEQIRRVKVCGFNTTLMDVLGQGTSNDKDKNVTNWFAKDYKLLYKLLRSAHRTNNIFDKPIIDTLFKQNYVLTWSDKKNCPIFKIDDFYVYL